MVSRAGFGQADVEDLALGDQFGQAPTVSSIGVCGIDPVLVEEVDVVGTEPFQRNPRLRYGCSLGCCRRRQGRAR